jgi:hypothetical protein
MRVTRHDSGGAPDQDKWAQVVSSAEDHVRLEASGAPAPRRPLPGRGVLLVSAGVLVTVGVALVAPRMFEGPPASLSSVEQASDLRTEVGLLVEQIEAFKEERGVLPAPAMLAPFLDEGYEYRITDRDGGRYEVRRRAGGVEVVYDGSLPLSIWLVIGGRSGSGT